MYDVPVSFHSECKEQSPLTRIRIYFIGFGVDCTDDADVQAHGTLLRLYPDDTDSGGRIDITSSPVVFTEYYNPNENIEIGRCVSNTISYSIINSDGLLNNFEYGKFKVYLDLYSDTETAWISVPMGVYIADVPERRRMTRVSISAYDQMRVFETSASRWWESLDYSNGLTYWDMVRMMCATLNVPVDSSSEDILCNNEYTFSRAPFGSGEFTYRELLSAICMANGCNAMFNRDGALQLMFYTDAEYGYSESDGIFSFDQSEFTSAPIDGVSVKTTDSDVGVLVGGDNAYIVSNNKFLNVSPNTETTEDMATNILSAFSALDNGFVPVSFSAVGDWSLQSGDVIPVVFGGNTFTVPVMQQSFTWYGSGVRAEIIANGSKRMPTVENAPSRSELEAGRHFHNLDITADQLLSRIQSIDGNYSQLLQTVETITRSVGDLNASVDAILDPNGEIWTFVRRTQNQLDNLDEYTEAQFAEYSTYIRFTNEPAIILGVNTGDEIKLKLVNNVIYFFNGSDDSSSIDNAFAYFNSDGVNADRVTAKEQVQIGDDSASWMWHIVDNGNLVLEMF